MVAWYQYPIVGDFGQQLPGFTYPVQGEDIGTPFHTPITTPFAGTVVSAYYDRGGGQVILKADDPSQLKGIPYFWVAHLDQIFSGIGQHLAAGGTLGISGGQNVGGSHPAATDESSGAHTEYGEAKSNAIPYTLATITPDLNPDWIPAYAQQHGIGAGSTNPPLFAPNIGTAPSASTTGNTCTCDPGYSLVQGGLGQNICRNQSFPFDTRPCKENQTTDPLTMISNFLAQVGPWLGDPVRIIKAVSGLMLIGLAIFLLISPQSGVAQVAAKGARKVGIQ
jgi:hypothetical protein